ncbi:unnamed protein product [Polarella glacialis]|uniref:Uncharacterized protein n=1 Tax=Polarella glacialis TaxID=89957 RepID=A0A813HB19_POLGL|nr:unnamed protein product [Polarella glacialis]
MLDEKKCADVVEAILGDLFEATRDEAADPMAKAAGKASEALVGLLELIFLVGIQECPQRFGPSAPAKVTLMCMDAWSQKPVGASLEPPAEATEPLLVPVPDSDSEPEQGAACFEATGQAEAGAGEAEFRDGSLLASSSEYQAGLPNAAGEEKLHAKGEHEVGTAHASVSLPEGVVDKDSSKEPSACRAVLASAQACAEAPAPSRGQRQTEETERTVDGIEILLDEGRSKARDPEESVDSGEKLTRTR